jgi:hypothetical protein
LSFSAKAVVGANDSESDAISSNEGRADAVRSSMNVLEKAFLFILTWG